MTITHYIRFDVHKKWIFYCVKTQDGTVVDEGKVAANRSPIGLPPGMARIPGIPQSCHATGVPPPLRTAIPKRWGCPLVGRLSIAD
jgi:hypothetical protein